MIGRSGERGSGISVLAAQHDNDNDDLKTHFLFAVVLLFYIDMINCIYLQLKLI